MVLEQNSKVVILGETPCRFFRIKNMGLLNTGSGWTKEKGCGKK
jgi:hypothetical protein